MAQLAPYIDTEKDIVVVGGKKVVNPELIRGIREMEDYLIELGHMSEVDRLYIPESLSPL